MGLDQRLLAIQKTSPEPCWLDRPRIELAYWRKVWPVHRYLAQFEVDLCWEGRANAMSRQDLKRFIKWCQNDLPGELELEDYYVTENPGGLGAAAARKAMKIIRGDDYEIFYWASL